MRYSAELSHHDVHEREVEELPGVYWVPEDERVTPAQFLRENQLSNTTTNRLKWMLQHTMGTCSSLRVVSAPLPDDDARMPDNICAEGAVSGWRDAIRRDQ